MKNLLQIALLMAVASIAWGLTGCENEQQKSPSKSPQAIAVPIAAPSAATLRAQGRTRESEIHLEELKCEGDLIGKTTPSDAHEFCHKLRRDDWEEWALQFPELARAREAAAQ